MEPRLADGHLTERRSHGELPLDPDGHRVLVCRRCQLVAASEVRCACGGQTVKAIVYNLPPVDATSGECR